MSLPGGARHRGVKFTDPGSGDPVCLRRSNTFEDIDHDVYTPYNLNYLIVPMPKLPKLSLHKLTLILIASLSTLCLNATAQQVYQSTDEQGNVSFSDTPTPGSQAVTIGEPNLSDAVEVPPPSSEPAPAPAPKPAAASGGVPTELDTTNNNLDDDDYYDGYTYRRRAVRRSHYLHGGPRGGR